MVNPVPLYISIKGINSMNFADGMSPMAINPPGTESINTMKEALKINQEVLLSHLNNTAAHQAALTEIEVNKGIV